MVEFLARKEGLRSFYNPEFPPQPFNHPGVPAAGS